jgi:hypothetical protein
MWTTAWSIRGHRAVERLDGPLATRGSSRDHRRVLNVLMAADAPDAGWNVTMSVAAVAAAISLVTLLVTTYFTGRRETVKWAREALAEAFYDFVNASYAAGQTFHEHQKLLWAGADPPSLDASAVEVETESLALRHAQTKIRLLARAHRRVGGSGLIPLPGRRRGSGRDRHARRSRAPQRRARPDAATVHRQRQEGHGPATLNPTASDPRDGVAY